MSCDRTGAARLRSGLSSSPVAQVVEYDRSRNGVPNFLPMISEASTVTSRGWGNPRACSQSPCAGSDVLFYGLGKLARVRVRLATVVLRDAADGLKSSYAFL
jgi:hypothetical protein